MNADIAKERIAEVANTDAVTSSEGDFLATHVKFQMLQVSKKFDVSRIKAKSEAEDQIFQEYIENPENIHQFIVVYGQSGSGKSNLIRWFDAKLSSVKPDDEVILFIRRTDNTLKGTIKQLLETPEVQSIPNKDIYERLLKASVTVDENTLKDMIYHNFIIDVNNDNDKYDITLNNPKRKKLVAFLSNEVVHDILMGETGPIERIYSKIAEQSIVKRDTIAQFEKKDFYITSQQFDEIHSAGADPKAESFARRLMTSAEGEKEAELVAKYLNQFVDGVIQRCAGIEPGDFKNIFLDIRRELYRQGKNLTLFIEDVTSFTGVDTGLIDALIEEHTGIREGDPICRISSIVGTTDDYLINNFRDNQKDRITTSIYIPDKVINVENGLVEFVARYVNTMSLTKEEIGEWVNNGAHEEDYPIHNNVEGGKWEHYQLEGGKEVSLFPFTKRSIAYFYNNVLEEGHRTPRYIIREIIEPVVRDAILNGQEFPSKQLLPSTISTNALESRIKHSDIHDSSVEDRLIRFMSVWGDGSTQKSADGKYLADICIDCYDDLELPIINGDVKSDSEPVLPDGPEPAPAPGTNEDDGKIPSEKLKKVNQANDLLKNLEDDANAKIDISTTGGIPGMIHSAIYDDIPAFIRSAIDWQSEGISPDNIGSITNSV